MSEPPLPARLPDWESFYASYRKPGYVPGFEITTKLGGGMFGLVFKATKQSIGKDYAIKFLKVEDGEVRRAVLAELEMVRHFAQVDHPNLVSIEDKGEVDGIPYLVMAYAGAETLQSLLPGGEGTRAETLRLFAQACRGVAALHEKSLVHFDLKPANVFLKGGVARVGDYGLSKLVTHSRGSLSMGRGTPYYMAPEMLQRRGDHRSDVYSLGVMLFEVLTGEVPFRGDSEWEVLRKHERGQIEFPPQVTAQQRAIVSRCMHKDPEQRFQSVHDLLAVLHGGAPRGTVPPPLHVAPPRVHPVATAMPTPPPLPGRAVEPPPLPPAGAAGAAVAPAIAARDHAIAQASELIAATRRHVRPRPRKSFFSAPLVMVFVLVGAFGYFLLARPDPQSAYAAASPRVSRTTVRTATSGTRPVVTVSSDGDVRDEIRRLARSIDNASRRRSSKTSLQPLDGSCMELPPDLSLYADELRQLVDASVASPIVLAQLEQLGYPIVLASVQWLQQQGYADRRSCHSAAQVLAFLERATAITDFTIEPPIGDPDAAATRRFQAAAEAWRKLVEGYAQNAKAYRTLLLATGKLPPDKVATEQRKN